VANFPLYKFRQQKNSALKFRDGIITFLNEFGELKFGQKTENNGHVKMKMSQLKFVIGLFKPRGYWCTLEWKNLNCVPPSTGDRREY